MERPPDYKFWRTEWFYSIDELSDLAGQRRTWLDPNQISPHFTYVEFICTYFDRRMSTSPDGYRELIEQGYLTDDEARAVSDLHLLIGAYRPPRGDNNDHIDILDDPSWHQVVNAAAVARDRLLMLLTDEEERQALATLGPGEY